MVMKRIARNQVCQFLSNCVSAQTPNQVQETSLKMVHPVLKEHFSLEFLLKIHFCVQGKSEDGKCAMMGHSEASKGADALVTPC